MRNGPYELVIAPAAYPGMKYRGRYAYEHSVVWWRETGQLVPADFVLHHVNANKRDNRIENLELLSRDEHTRQHNLKHGTLHVYNIPCRCKRCCKTARLSA